MNKQTQQLLVLKYQFTVELIQIIYNNKIDSDLRFTLRIGPKQQNTKKRIVLKNNRAEIYQKLVIQNQIIYYVHNKIYENLKAMIKIHLITPRGEKLTGLVYLSLNQYLTQNHNPNLQLQKKIQNCPDPNAKLFFKITFQNITQEKKLSFSNFDEFIEQDSLNCARHQTQQINSLNSFRIEDSNITISIGQEHPSQYGNYTEQITQLKQKNIRLQIKQKLQKEKAFRYRQKYQAQKKIASELKEIYCNLLKQCQKQKKMNQQNTLIIQKMEQIRNQNKELKLQIEKLKKQDTLFENCNKCTNVKEQCQIRLKNYEEQLQILQSLLEEIKQRAKDSDLKCQNQLIKYEILKCKLQKTSCYQKILCEISQALSQLTSKLPLNLIVPQPLSMQQETLESPQNIKIYFQNYFQFLEKHLNTLIFKQDNSPKKNNFKIRLIDTNDTDQNQLIQAKILQMNLVKAQSYISKMNIELEDAIQKLQQLQQENSNLKTQLQLFRNLNDSNRLELDKKSLKSSIRQSGVITPHFDQMSFMKQNHDFTLYFKDIEAQQKNEIVEKKESLFRQSFRLTKLNQQIKHLQQQLQAQKEKLKGLQLENNANKKMIQSLKEQDEQKLKQKNELMNEIQCKSNMIQNLQIIIEELQKKIQEFKQETSMKNDQISTLKNQNHNLKTKSVNKLQGQNTNSNYLESKIKFMLQSLEQQQVQDSSPQQFSEVDTKVSQYNQLKVLQNPVHIDIIQLITELQNKMSSLSLQFLRMKCFKISKCKNEEQTKEILEDFKNIKGRIDQIIKFIKCFSSV